MSALDRLKAVLGARATDAAVVRDHHSRGESYHAPAAPDIVCFPTTTAEVVEIVVKSQDSLRKLDNSVSDEYELR